eukprot:364359-Chlamydomonas_euryale.AAC.1
MQLPVPATRPTMQLPVPWNHSISLASLGKSSATTGAFHRVSLKRHPHYRSQARCAPRPHHKPHKARCPHRPHHNSHKACWVVQKVFQVEQFVGGRQRVHHHKLHTFGLPERCEAWAARI